MNDRADREPCLRSTTVCIHCGCAIPFQEEDRGCDVYCPSCARANWIPATAEPVDTATPPGGFVFSAEGAAQLEGQIIGEVACLCGVRVPARLQDVGRTVYCPSCGTAIDVSEGMLSRLAESELSKTPFRDQRNGQDLSGLAPSDTESTRSTVSSVAQPGATDPGRHRRLWTTAVAIILAALVTLAGQTAWRYRDAMPRLIQWTPLATAPERPTSSASERLPESPNQPPQHSSPILPDPIGMKPQPPTPHRAEFERRVESFAQALKAQDVARARAEFLQAEAYLKEHVDELADSALRFLALKIHLERQAASAGATHRIQGLLEQANQATESGRVTEAIQVAAQACFLARIAPAANEADVVPLRERVRQLNDRIRLAQGRRAVADAQHASQQNDLAARNYSAQRAFSLLPGFPESQVRPLLESVRPWWEESQRSSLTLSHRGIRSTLERSLRQRDTYESFQEHYGNVDCARMIAAWRELTASGQNASTSPTDAISLEAAAEPILLDILERETISRLWPADMAKRSEAREPALELASVVKQVGSRAKDYRWKVLNAILLP